MGCGTILEIIQKWLIIVFFKQPLYLSTILCILLSWLASSWPVTKMSFLAEPWVLTVGIDVPVENIAAPPGTIFLNAVQYS